MARSRRRFGPLFYLTAGLAALVIASIPLWEPGIQQFGAWRLTRRLHDPAESVRREAAEGLVQLGPAATWWVIRRVARPGRPGPDPLLFHPGTRGDRRRRAACRGPTGRHPRR